MKTKLNVYEDGDNVGEVEVDITNMKDLKQVLKDEFDCGRLRNDDIEVNCSGDEIYVGISETQYLWNK